MTWIDPWFLEHLRCPVDGLSLVGDEAAGRLCCAGGHSFPVVDGVPVMLPPDTDPTLEAVHASMHPERDEPPYYLKSVLLNDEQRQGIRELAASGRSKVDPVAAFLVGATSGLGYVHLVGQMTEYPIPEMRLPRGDRKVLLDIGCSWGRWCVAAARQGYQPVGIDPSLAAVMAARRVMRDCGQQGRFIVGDARHLPLRARSFDAVFSYSVIQHFSVEDATRTFGHVGRVLKPGGQCFIQMPTRYGLRCLYNQARRSFRETRGFEVRYWTLAELRRVFEEKVGPVDFAVDCFFGIGWQPSDARFMPASFKAIIAASELLRKASAWCSPLKQVADSVYVSASAAK